MKIMTVLGTRPEIIRLSRVIARLDALCDHVVVHTGQNFDPQLREVFFRELRVRLPDHNLTAQGSFGEQLATILCDMERLLKREKPDRLLILGDTNSGLAAIVAKRPGSRCFTWKPAIGAMTTACRKRSIAGSSTTAAMSGCLIRSAAGRIFSVRGLPPIECMLRATRFWR